ncbi:hypothetical protein NQZ68_005969 [Dissostichus eleginoides]|nr:hypothetical protein NQZ68_005969 [Dissostichus eleginoides]
MEGARCVFGLKETEQAAPGERGGDEGLPQGEKDYKAEERHSETPQKGAAVVDRLGPLWAGETEQTPRTLVMSGRITAAEGSRCTAAYLPAHIVTCDPVGFGFLD